MRFFMESGLGSGNYTAEREKILGNPTIDQLMTQIRAERRRSKTKRAKAS
jgi:hypothetical protein